MTTIPTILMRVDTFSISDSNLTYKMIIQLKLTSVKLMMLARKRGGY